MSDDIHARGRTFLRREARLLERRLYATLYEGADAQGVVDALRGYRNADGGFGHGLEPDKLSPASVPGDVEFALQTLATAGSRDESLIARACGFLASVADGAGAVALASPVIENHPRAEHWTDWTYVPGVFPTAGLAGLLHGMEVEHPWLERATEYCWTAMEGALPDDAHALAEVLRFCEHVPDRVRAGTLAARVVEHLPGASWYLADPQDPSYGVTPLHIATRPDHPWRPLFPDAVVEGHLDRLVRDQQADGGWPITWEPPSEASRLAWRGIETLRALNVLTAYGRVAVRQHRW